MKPFFKIFYIFFLLICGSAAYSQSIIWRQILGEQYNEVGNDVIELRDKGFLMVGTKEMRISGTGSLQFNHIL